jgi:hypothetical protein
MTGDREQRVTYLVFLSDSDGWLVFRYRDGRSGSGDDLDNVSNGRFQPKLRVKDSEAERRGGSVGWTATWGWLSSPP